MSIKSVSFTTQQIGVSTPTSIASELLSYPSLHLIQRSSPLETSTDCSDRTLFNSSNTVSSVSWPQDHRSSSTSLMKGMKPAPTVPIRPPLRPRPFNHRDLSYISECVLRFIQLIFAAVVAELYGADILKIETYEETVDSRWFYAVIVAGITGISSTAWMIPRARENRSLIWWWDLVIFILWAVLFSIFAKMYLPTHFINGSGVERMRNAVWVNLVNMAMWFISAVSLMVLRLIIRDKRSLYTSNARYRREVKELFR